MKKTAAKIDFLMKLTATSNAMLARKLGFDASYISRIRNGKRGLPPEQPFIKPACALFAKRVRDDFQKRALADELGQPWPEQPAKARALLVAWLEEEPINVQTIETVVGAITSPAKPLHDNITTSRMSNGAIAPVKLFYGNDGKREGVLAFLSALCETGASHTLLLYSDEDMSWLYEDRSFAAQWTALLLQIIGNGSSMRIIHSVSRDANEMWEATQKWIPLYLTGAIEPYYYPRLRDGIFRRTLFIAQGHSVMTSSSVQGTHGNMANILIEDTTAVAAFEAEFNDYFELCRPLMKVAFPSDPSEAAEILAPFVNADDEITASRTDEALICTRGDTRALVASLKSPYVSFEITEPRMAAAVWEYLNNLPSSSKCTNSQAKELLADLVHRTDA